MNAIPRAPAETQRPQRTQRTLLLAFSALSGLIVGAVVTGQQPPTSVFTAAQADAGRAAYQASCAACHMPDLTGRNEAPPLAGANFTNTWRTRSTRDLFEFMSTTMPPDAPSLPADQYLAITAFILQSNGATPGAQAFTPTTPVTIGTAIAAGADPRVRPATPPPGDNAGPTRGSAAPPQTAGRGDADAPAATTTFQWAAVAAAARTPSSGLPPRAR